MNKKQLLLALGVTLAGTASAQLSSNPDKFLGNITTSYNVDYGNEKYYTLWNQITCENESKWASVEGNNNSFNWGGSDNAYNYAKSHNFPFKFHALVWGSQYPSWLEKQTPEQRYKEIVQWMDAAKKKYPDLKLIDVANECISGHQAGTPYFIEALGGPGKTGWDWLIKAFELAYERWPNAILIYNDFNTFQWNTDQYIELVKTLRDAGAPIDAYGCQAHDLTDCNLTNFKNSMVKIQNALKMPMYITEYDIGTDDDAYQKQRYQEQFPYMWEADYCAGVTLWGYIYGKTWTTNGNSGIIKNGKDRPAMTWLREYMKTDKAKNAKSPFPGMKKEASVYVKPEALNVEKGNPFSVLVRAKMKSKTIEKVSLYAKGALVGTLTEAPYEFSVQSSTTGKCELKAVVTTTDGSSWTRYSEVTVCTPRAPYKNTPTDLPGILQLENFDSGADGLAFHDNNSQKQGDAASYRSDTGGVDVIKCGTGYGIGWTEVGEWMEYTVNVKEAGLYSYDISYAAPEDGATVNMELSNADGQTLLTESNLLLAKTGDWSAYKTCHGRILLPLEEGEQRIRFNIKAGNGTYVVNLDKITFKRVEINEDLNIAISADEPKGMVGKKSTISVDVPEGINIANVKVYLNGILYKTLTSAPYQFTYTPTVKGTQTFTAIATDSEGKESQLATLKYEISPKRTPYSGTAISIPGIIEAENFDKGEEGFTFHDSDDNDEGKANYRSDNAGVDIKKAANGGYVLGWTAVNEWYEYTVNVKEAGTYTCEAICSSGTTGSGFNVGLVDNGKVTTLWRISVPQTGNNSWDTYKTVKSTVQKELSEGIQTIRITIFGANCDIDKVELKCVATGIENVATLEPSSYDVFTTSGIYVGKIAATNSADIRQQILQKTSKTGIYIIKNKVSGTATKIAVNR